MKPSIRMDKRRAKSANEIGFFPADPWADERFHTDYKIDQPYGVVVSNPARNGMLGLWFAGIRLLFDNQEEYATERKLHEAILKDLGLSHPVYRIDGTFVKDVVDSIALEAMTDEEMTVVQEKARSYAEGRWGYDPWRLWVEQQDAKKGRR